jgi:hypothetical protein
VQAPIHIRRKSRYWNALKTRWITIEDSGERGFCPEA